MITAFLNAQLQKRKTQGTLRTLPSAQGLVDLTSNDYFGFAHARELPHKEACQIGATGSRLLTGNHPFSFCGFSFM
mgnify:FL=1